MQTDLMLIHSRRVSSRRGSPDLSTTGNLHVKAHKLQGDSEGKRETLQATSLSLYNDEEKLWKPSPAVEPERK